MADDPQVPDLGNLLSQAMQMQQEVMAAQAAVAEQVVEGQAGGGVVAISVTGGMEFRGVRISPDAVDPTDVELLQDLVLAALHDAVAKVNDLQARSLGGVGDLLSGGGLGGLAGLGGADPFGGPIDPAGIIEGEIDEATPREHGDDGRD